MQPVGNLSKEVYTEFEAAAWLGITVSRLHQLLDRNIFNDGAVRPKNLTFRASELVVLSVWNRQNTPTKVLCMPKRY